MICFDAHGIAFAIVAGGERMPAERTGLTLQECEAIAASKKKMPVAHVRALALVKKHWPTCLVKRVGQ